MAEQLYDRVNDYASVKINIASPNDIRSWSFGEVKKPASIQAWSRINSATWVSHRDHLGDLERAKLASGPNA